MFLFIIPLIQETYHFKGKSETVTLYAGQYTVNCYGAQGGDGSNNYKKTSDGGLGAYVRGTMKVEGTGTLFYINVGGQGSSGGSGNNDGGYNGGGTGGKDTGIWPGAGDSSGGGGGATDLRIYSNSTSNRIIVAAGGSGGANQCNGAPGGDLTGYYPTSNNNFVKSTSTTQVNPSTYIGGSGKDTAFTPGSGGGGGYRGGVSSNDHSDVSWTSWKAIAHSGSSYISGYSGCIKHSKMSFTNGYMSSGFRYGNGMLTINYDYVCSSNCAACTSASVCTRCFNNFYMYQNKCYSKCPSNTLQSGSKCIDCTSPCATCSSTVTHCETCINGYYLYNGKCYNDCTALNNKNKDLYYGKDTLNKKCSICKDENCIDCSQNYAKCTTCAVGFHYETSSQKCVLNPTNVFTSSAKFTASNAFSPSHVFSQTKAFSQSDDFSSSFLFTKSSPFTESKAFSSSNAFSQSQTFTPKVTQTEVPPQTLQATQSEVPPEQTPIASQSEVPPEQTPIASQSEVPPDQTPIASQSEVPPRTLQATQSEVPPEKTSTATQHIITPKRTPELPQQSDVPPKQTPQETKSLVPPEQTPKVSQSEFQLHTEVNSELTPTLTEQFSSIQDRDVNLIGSADSKNRKKSMWWIIAVVLGVAIIVTIIIIIIWRKRKSNQDEASNSQQADCSVDQLSDLQNESEPSIEYENPLGNFQYQNDPFSDEFEES